MRSITDWMAINRAVRRRPAVETEPETLTAMARSKKTATLETGSHKPDARARHAFCGVFVSPSLACASGSCCSFFGTGHTYVETRTLLAAVLEGKRLAKEVEALVAV